MKRYILIYLTAIAMGLLIAMPVSAALASSAGVGGMDFTSLYEEEGESESGSESESAGVEPSLSHAGMEIDGSVRIAEGVYIGDENHEIKSLGGMNAAEAKAAIEEFYNEIGNAAVIVKAGEKEFQTTLYKLGLQCNTEGILEECVFLGQYGGLIRRYKDLTDIKTDRVVFAAKYSLDEDKINAFIRDEICVLDADATNASISRVDGEFVVTPEIIGWETDLASTRENILAAVAGGLDKGLVIQADVKIEKPYKTAESLGQIKDRLGSYTTDYGSSASGRKTNIKIASGNLNGLVVMPGDSFSVSNMMKERSPENGYEIAGEYVDGETVDAYGGGVCQVATTIYNALLKAEIQIDKRYNHSMLVSYVQPSFDAAIATGSKDLVFTNNTGAPIYIASSCDGETLTFSIYGKEYRSSSHKVTYEPVIVERIESVAQTIEDPTLPVGTTEKKGQNHDKCTSYLRKIVYENGEVAETVDFKMDYYDPSFQTIKVGTMPVETLPEESTTGESESAGTDDPGSETAEPESEPESETTEEDNGEDE